MSIKKSSEINKNALADLWQDWDYETLEQRYYEIKRAEVRAAKQSLSEEDRKNWHLKIVETLIGYNMKVNHPENFDEVLDLLNQTFDGHNHGHYWFEMRDEEHEECPDGSCSPQEYHWKKRLLKSKGLIDENGKLRDKINFSNIRPDFSVLEASDRKSQIQKNKENNLDDLWKDWHQETVEQRYYELKRAETRLPYCYLIQDDDEFLLTKTREVMRELSIPCENIFSFSLLIKSLDEHFSATNLHLCNVNFNLPFTYTRSDWPAAVYREYIWRKLLLNSKEIHEEPDSRWKMPTNPPDLVLINLDQFDFGKTREDVLRPFWKNWSLKSLEEQAEIIKLIYALVDGLMLSGQDWDLLFERESEVNRKLHPEKYPLLRIASKKEIDDRISRVCQVEQRIMEDLGPNDFISMTPSMSPFCEADQDENEYDINEAVRYFEDLMGITPKKKVKN